MRTAVWIVMWSDPVMRTPASGFSERILFANGHQPWHLLFGNRNFLAPPIRESDVADFEVGCWR